MKVRPKITFIWHDYEYESQNIDQLAIQESEQKVCFNIANHPQNDW